MNDLIDQFNEEWDESKVVAKPLPHPIKRAFHKRWPKKVFGVRRRSVALASAGLVMSGILLAAPVYRLPTVKPVDQAASKLFHCMEARTKDALVDCPIIGNKRSKIYHVPGGQYYRTVGPDNRIFFQTMEEAEAAGYRKAKR